MALDETRTGRFIDALVEDLVPVRPARAWSTTLLGWTALSLTWVILVGPTRGGLRPGAAAALQGLEPLAWETLCGALAAMALLGVGLELGVPGARPARLMLPAALALSGLWLVLVLGGEPVVGTGPMPLGKRAHCFLESLGLSIVPLVLAQIALARRAAHRLAIAGVLLGAASACLPALVMQLVCMYDPGHALRHHLTPILPMATIGAGIAAGIGAWRARR